MNWYYVEAGQQAGPVPESELDELVRAGRIKADTLVWQEGMANWRPFWEAKPDSGLSLKLAEAPGAATDAAPSPPAAALTGAEVVCAECNGLFSKDNAIQYGGTWVCANCKPVFVQKLKEGAILPGLEGALPYAGFWIRFGAKFIDGLILLVVVGVPIFLLVFRSLLTGGPGRGSGGPFEQMGLQVVLQLVYYGASLAFNVFFIGKYGATPGKMACGLRVVTAEGAKVSYARALGRALAELLSGLICNIGYIIAAFDSEKRALHDHICNTRVIKTR